MQRFIYYWLSHALPYCLMRFARFERERECASDRKEKEKGSFSKSGQNKDFAKLLRILEAKFFRNNLSFLLSNCPCHVFKMLVFLNFPIILLCCIVVFGLSLNRVRNGFVVVRNDVEVKRLVSIGY